MSHLVELSPVSNRSFQAAGRLFDDGQANWCARSMRRNAPVVCL